MKSNLVLSIGFSDTKASRLFGRGEVPLKRFATTAEAERLADKFYQAGALCEIRDSRHSSGNPGAEVGGESSLVRILKHFTANTARNSLLKKKKRA